MSIFYFRRTVFCGAFRWRPPSAWWFPWEVSAAGVLQDDAEAFLRGDGLLVSRIVKIFTENLGILIFP